MGTPPKTPKKGQKRVKKTLKSDQKLGQKSVFLMAKSTFSPKLTKNDQKMTKNHHFLHHQK